ncbi:MAG TPA: hypothetical protein VFK33_06795 [Bacillales bacterium]|nr:hypothetical protein [Bacillales bacterium]
MSAHHDFIKEKEQIDELVKQGYAITGVTEHLNGADVTFQKADGQQVIHVGNADARKYFSAILIKQQKKS